MKKITVSRKEFLKLTGVVTAGAVAAACAPAATAVPVAAIEAPAATSAPAATNAPAATSVPEATAVPAVAVSDGPKKGGVLNVGLHIPFATLDWQATVQHPAPHVQSNVWEGLTAYAKDFTAALELAESIVPTDSGKVWTINLRQGVLFHNLKEMTSADVKASVERWLKVGPKGLALAPEVDKVDATDKYVVTLTFKNPIGQTLLLLLGSDENKCVIMPKEICDASPEANKLSEIIGTGPYKWTEYKEDQYILLTRFDGYVPRSDAPNYQTGMKVPYMDQIKFWIVPETSTRIAGLSSCEYDVILEVPDTEYDNLTSTNGVRAVKIGPADNLYIMFNHQKGLTSNILIRKAIQAALNADEIMAAAVPNPAFRLLDGSFFPPESAYHNAARVELYNMNNIEKSKEYLKQAGYNGEPITYQVIGTNETQVRTGTAVVGQLKKAGMNAEVLTYDLQTWVAKRRDGNALMMYNSGGHWIDPSMYQPEFNGTFPSKETGFKDPEVDKVFEELNRATDTEKRKVLAQDLQTLFYDKVATYNIGYRYKVGASRDYVMDPEGNLALGNLTLNNIWLNK